MGSGASAAASEVPGGDLRLPASGLRFTASQLQALNGYVDTLWEDDQKGRITKEQEITMEGLVKKLVDGAGHQDPRFKCNHIIALHQGKKMRSKSLEYLVTLDALPVLNGSSEECKFEDSSIGYAKIRLTGREADKWEEFLTPSGYLCRDKVCERWVSLLARAAGDGLKGAHAGGGGPVLGAQECAHALPYTYCYLERAGVRAEGASGGRLALVQGAWCVWVRAGAADAKLLLALRGAGAPPRAHRLALTHPLALLYYSNLHMGFYCVSAGGAEGAEGAGERGAGGRWQVWAPALRHALDAQLSARAPAARLAGALNALLDYMRGGHYQGSLGSVSRYMCWCVYRRRLERCGALPTAAARALLPAHLSHHLLLVLDELLSVCGAGGANAAVGYPVGLSREHVARRGARGRWPGDAACLRELMLRLHNMTVAEIPASPSDGLWAALCAAVSRGRGPGAGGVGYSHRQLRYLALLCTHLRQCTPDMDPPTAFRANLLQATSAPQQLEELVHTMAIMLDQARDQYVNAFYRNTWGEGDHEIHQYRSKKWNKLKSYYDASSACLIDAVRRDRDLWSADLSDPIVMMKSVLSWLHKGAKDDKKYLGPVLKPFLDELYKSSMENSWFVDDLDGVNPELEGLRDYCLRVHEGKVDPCLGLLDAANKFVWAKVLVDFVTRFKHVEFRLVFPGREGAVRVPVSGAALRGLAGRGGGGRAGAAGAVGGVRGLGRVSRRQREDAKLRLARNALRDAFTHALVGHLGETQKPLPRHESEEILTSVKNGNFWRSDSKPDIISTTVQEIDRPRVRRRSRRSRPATSHGFPSININSECDQKTLRRKYHTLRNLVYTGESGDPGEFGESGETRRPRSAGTTLARTHTFSRPSILETVDFINSVKDSLCVEESGASDAEVQWGVEEERGLRGAGSPLGGCVRPRAALTLTHTDLLHALLRAHQYTVLQELCSWLPEGREGALYALHRLARAARARSSERDNSWQLPSTPTAIQRYRVRSQDQQSEDERPPPPPPLPRRTSRDKMLVPRYADYLPPSRVEAVPPRTQYTGIINPIYDIKIPRDKFEVKRSRSLGRSFSTKSLGIDINKYNLTLGHRSGRKTNDVITAIEDTTGETGVESKCNYFQKQASNVVGDSYRVSRVTID